MDLRRTILLLRSFPKLLLIISTITITAGFKLKQNGCLPLNSGKHPCLNLNYSFFIQCPENWVHITPRGFFLFGVTILTFDIPDFSISDSPQKSSAVQKVYNFAHPPGTSSLRASSRRAVVSGRSLAASIWPGETWYRRAMANSSSPGWA